MFLVFVGARIPQDLHSGHFPRERVVIVGDSKDLLEMSAEMFAYPAKGKLAKKPTR